MLSFLGAFSQETSLEHDEAYKSFTIITDSMERILRQDDIQEFERNSFTNDQIQDYLTLHFKRIDLLPKIKGNYRERLESYFFSGNFFMQTGFINQANKSYKDFLRYYKAYDHNFTNDEKLSFMKMLAVSYNSLAENYAKMSMIDSTKLMIQASIDLTKPIKTVYYPSSINNYGLHLYLHQNNLVAAQDQFKKAYEITSSNFPEHTLIGSIRDNIADILVDQDSLSSALPLYIENFEFYQHAINEVTHKKDIARLVSAGSQTIETLIKLGRLEDARRYYDAMSRLMSDAEIKRALSIRSVLEFLNVEEILELKSKNVQGAYQTLQRIQQINDSLKTANAAVESTWRKELNEINLDRVALNFEIDKIQSDNQLRRERSKLWIISLVAFIMIVILLSLFLNRKQRLQNARNERIIAEQELENSKLKVQQLNAEIISKERDLTDFAINLTQNRDWTRKISSKLKQVNALDSKEQKAMLKKIDLDIANKITYDEDTKLFFDRLDTLSDNFYKKLNKRFPKLSKNEIRLCSLIRLKIESRSIATLQNITLSSLNTSRYRLRKKLELSAEVDLDDFIQNF